MDECLFGKFPTLSDLNAKFDSRFSTAWVMAHLHDLSEYCGCKEKLYGNPLKQCAAVIADNFYYLKLTELMLFFHRFKSGVYGRFYGSIDPLIITTSIREFLKERSVLIERRNSAIRDTERQEWRRNAVSWEEYQKT